MAINLVEKLKESQVFKNISDDDLEALVQMMERREFKAGEVLFHRGDEGDSMVEIIEGKIRIYTEDSEGNELTLVFRGPGELVGELSLLDQEPRSASVMAVEDSKVLVLDREHFITFLKDRPAVGLQLMLTLTGRIRYTTTYLQRVVDWMSAVNDGKIDEALAAVQNTEDEIGDMQRLINHFMGILGQMQSDKAQ